VAFQVVQEVLCLKMKSEPTSEMLRFFKKLDDGQSPKEEDCVS
jgi:hypothetical protein